MHDVRRSMTLFMLYVQTALQCVDTKNKSKTTLQVPSATPLLDGLLPFGAVGFGVAALTAEVLFVLSLELNKLWKKF